MLTNFLAYLELNLIRATRSTEFYQPTYNPKHLPLWSTPPVKRSCQDRLDLITQNLDFKQIHSVLDIGSQLGYFCFELAAQKNVFALGIDHDTNALRYAKCLERLNQTKHTAFSHFELTNKTVKQLPATDLILFQDVFHHLVWHQGFAAADTVFSKLAAKCKYMVFETGQSNEPNQPWTDSLSFMNPEPEIWLTAYLHKHSLKIIHQATLPTHLTSQPRTFFICERKEQR